MDKICSNDGCTCTPNSAIHCDVTNCAHHCRGTSYCGLNAIQVGRREDVENHCTDCQSFRTV